MHHTQRAKGEVGGEVEGVVVDVDVDVQSLRIKWPNLLLISCKSVIQHKHTKVFDKNKITCLDSFFLNIHHVCKRITT